MCLSLIPSARILWLVSRCGRTRSVRPLRMGGRRRSASVVGSYGSSVGVLEFCRLLGSAGCISGAVGPCPPAGQLAAIDDEIFVADRPPLKEALEDFPCSGCVSGLGR